MTGPPQADDRGTALFPDGRGDELEYAREVVTRGTPRIVVLAIDRGGTSGTVEESSIKTVRRIDGHVNVVGAGRVLTVGIRPTR